MINNKIIFKEFEICVADEEHYGYIPLILKTIAKSAKKRRTGIAKRNPDYIKAKMREGKAIIALKGDEFAGFCYIECWQKKQYVANSGLIVAEQFRGEKLASEIKKFTFRHTREMFPEAKLFTITTNAAVMKINQEEFGYRLVTFADLPKEKKFWQGCEGCSNYYVLLHNMVRNRPTYCACSAMIFDPAKDAARAEWLKKMPKD